MMSLSEGEVRNNGDNGAGDFIGGKVSGQYFTFIPNRRSNLTESYSI